MTRARHTGGIIHTYQKYDPQHFPSPTQPPPDVVSPALEHMMLFGGLRELSEEELARAVRLDPSQIAGLGPSLDALIALLRERKRKILEKYETDTVQEAAARQYHGLGGNIAAPRKLRASYQRAYADEQLYLLERIWYATGDDVAIRPPTGAADRAVGTKYEIDELAYMRSWGTP
jgi:hypothetical protein